MRVPEEWSSRHPARGVGQNPAYRPSGAPLAGNSFDTTRIGRRLLRIEGHLPAPPAPVPDSSRDVNDSTYPQGLGDNIDSNQLNI
jgi:hypothetical protein